MIIANFDLNSGWTFKGEPESTFGVQFSKGDAKRIYPDDFSFGWEYGQDFYEWPFAGVIVREITPQRVFEFKTGAKIDDKVFLRVWARNAGVVAGAETSWIIPRPPQFFPSWVWDNGGWEPPVQYPNDGGFYEWDEESLSWATADPISEQGDD